MPVFVHQCVARGTSDLRARCTPRSLAGGLSTLGGRVDLIFHRSAAHPWTPSLSPHGRPESCSVNTGLKYAACQPPLRQCCSLTCWASQLKSEPRLQMLAAVFNPWDATLPFSLQKGSWHMMLGSSLKVCVRTRRVKRSQTQKKGQQPEMPKAFCFEFFQAVYAS